MYIILAIKITQLIFSLMATYYSYTHMSYAEVNCIISHIEFNCINILIKYLWVLHAKQLCTTAN